MKNNKQFDKLILAFFKLEPFLPGAITKQYKICGKPNCRCMDKENPRKHPSFQLSYTLENKRSTVYIKKSDVKIAQEMTEVYKNARKIITDMALESIKLTRQHGAEETFKIIDAANVAEQMVKRLSTIANASNMNGTLKPEAVSLSNVIQESIDLTENTIKDNKFFFILRSFSLKSTKSPLFPPYTQTPSSQKFAPNLN